MAFSVSGLAAVASLCLAGCAHRVDLAHFPAANAPNRQGLVSPNWLKQALDFQRSGGKTARPATYDKVRLLVLDVSWATLDKAKDYRRGHVPGAIHFNTDDLETGHPTWRLKAPEELRRVFGQAGVSQDTTVVVYGKPLIGAARVWWALKYAGLEDARLLDGGFQAWASAGCPVETEIRKPTPTTFKASTATGFLATTDYVRRKLGSPDVWLADARSEDEFLGRKSGYSYLDAKGRIPSAIHVGDGDDGSLLYRQGDGKLCPPAEVLDLWRTCGITPAKGGGRFEREVIFYCGGGWRSSLAFFYAWLMGFDNIRNYSDSWSGWSTDYEADPSAKGGTPGWRQRPTGNPIERGMARARSL